MPTKKSEGIGVAMERVTTEQSWSQVWDGSDAFPPDVGSMLVPFAVTGGTLPDPIIFLGLGLVVLK